MLKEQVQRDNHPTAGDQRRPTEFFCEVSGNLADSHRVQVESRGERSFAVSVNDGVALEVELLRFDAVMSNGVPTGRLSLYVDGIRRDLVLAPGTDNSISLLLDGLYEEIRVGHRKRRMSVPSVAQEQKDWQHLTAPMPAIVTEILVEPGMQVTAEQPVLRLEAMKMIIALSAPRDCVVDYIDVSVKQTVTADQILMFFRLGDTP